MSNSNENGNGVPVGPCLILYNVVTNHLYRGARLIVPRFYPAKIKQAEPDILFIMKHHGNIGKGGTAQNLNYLAG